MKKLRAVAKRYRFFLLLAGINLVLLVAVPQTGFAALTLTKDNFLEMLSVLPPHFYFAGAAGCMGRPADHDEIHGRQ